MIPELAHLADETGLDITVCHLPSGTPKRNKIEHRLFSHIWMNRRGRPLESHEIIVNTIGGDHHLHRADCACRTGHPQPPQGITITDQQMEGLERRALRRPDFHGEWNYILVPQCTHDPPQTKRVID